MTQHPATAYELILFDLDGTLISSYMDDPHKRFDRWEVLPGRVLKLADLRAYGVQIGIVTNQAGVAFGHIEEADVTTKLTQVAAALRFGHLDIYDGGEPHSHYGAARTPGLLNAYVCYADARSQDARYRHPAQVARRKPAPDMINEACALTSRDRVLVVGDRPEDEQAARAAGVAFQWSEEFFS